MKGTILYVIAKSSIVIYIFKATHWFCGYRKNCKMKNLTPYQGGNRQFGYFNCKSCNRNWQSGHTWANTGQICKNCNAMVYPYKQQPLEEPVLTLSNEINDPHPEHLCGKCIRLGYSCKNYK